MILFLADRRVVPLLPKMLGKQFFRKRRIPAAVDLEHKNWKEQVEMACRSAMMYLRTGTCELKVGRVSMGREKSVENVVAVIRGVGEAVPRKWSNMRSLHLKLLESLALPVYRAVPDARLRIEGGKDGEEEGDRVVETEAVEKVGKWKKKGRINEIRYMDEDIAGLPDVDDSDFDIDDDGASHGGGNEVVGKKRKKGGEENVSKTVNKVNKVKKGAGVKPKKVKVGK